MVIFKFIALVSALDNFFFRHKCRLLMHSRVIAALYIQGGPKK